MFGKKKRDQIKSGKVAVGFDAACVKIGVRQHQELKEILAGKFNRLGEQIEPEGAILDGAECKPGVLGRNNVFLYGEQLLQLAPLGRQVREPRRGRGGRHPSEDRWCQHLVRENVIVLVLTRTSEYSGPRSPPPFAVYRSKQP